MIQSLLSRVGSLKKSETLQIIASAEKIFSPLTTRIVELNVEKLTVCGDIHGQFSDLKHIFKLNGVPSRDNPYLFNGDFVDRGPNSRECISTLLLYKLLDPACMHLNRGNHEFSSLNAYYGFKQELGGDEQLFTRFNQLFELLPLAHVVNKEHFVVHGGIPRRSVAVSDLIAGKDWDRELIDDLVWSDPQEAPGSARSPRGVSRTFGPDMTRKFLEKNRLKSLIRSHEMMRNGIQVSQNGLCTTVFSASNYGGWTDNKGGFLVLRKGSSEISHHTFSVFPVSKL